MQLLRIVTQFEDGSITKGVIPLKGNTDAKQAVITWVIRCQNAGIGISFIQYGINDIYDHTHIFKGELKIDIKNY